MAVSAVEILYSLLPNEMRFECQESKPREPRLPKPEVVGRGLRGPARREDYPLPDSSLGLLLMLCRSPEPSRPNPKPKRL